jgi:plastocyanin
MVDAQRHRSRRDGGWFLLPLAWLGLAAPALAGTITGVVDMPPTPPAKVAVRYAGARPGSEKPLARVPTVVYLEGAVPGAPPFPRPAGAAIVQKDTVFTPSVLAVPVGTPVAFPNEDDEFHNVFSYSQAKRFDLGRYPKRESKTVTFDRIGIVKIYCEIHPWMRAAVLVLENPFYAVADENGRFTIGNLPPGTHRLVAWNMDGGSRRIEVKVGSDDVREIRLSLAGDAPPAVEERILLAGSLSQAPSEGGAECCGASGR